MTVTTKNKGKVNRSEHKKVSPKQRNQKKFLKVYFESLGHISNACKKVGIGRTIYYEWMKEESFKEQFIDITEAFDDDIETTIRKIAKGGDKDLLKFWADRKLKKRGFTQKIETEHTGQVIINVNIPKEVKEMLKDYD